MKTGSAPPPKAHSPRVDAGPVVERPEAPQLLARAGQTKRFAEQVVRADERARGGTPTPGGTAPKPRAKEQAQARADDTGRPDASFKAGSPVEEKLHQEMDRLDDSDASAGPGILSTGERGPIAGAAQRAEAAAPLPDNGHIERMAAAIAEIAASGAQVHYTIEFPGGLLASGAVMARDAQGALVLALVGTDPRLSARQADQIRADLTLALSRRRLRVSRIDLSGSPRPTDPVARARG